MSSLPPIAEELSVVVPTVGRPMLEGCLRSIRYGSMWPAQLIVVNQGTAQAAARWIEELRSAGLSIEHVPVESRGISAATNTGLARVETDFVATTHDDCRVDQDWVRVISARVRDVGDAVLTGRVEPKGDGIVLTIMTSQKPAVHTEPIVDGDVLFPPNMAVPRRLFETVGYFDEHPSLRTAGEDNEWAYRVLKAGFPIVYEPEMVVHHLAWQRREELLSLYRRYARGQGAFYGKYLLLGDRFIIRRTLRDLARSPWLLVRGAFTFNRDLIAMGAGELTGLLPGIVAGMRGRKPTEDRRACTEGPP